MALNNEIKGMPSSHEDSTKIASGSFRDATVEALLLDKDKYNSKKLGSGTTKDIDPLSKAVVEYVYNNNIEAAKARFSKNGDILEYNGKIKDAKIRHEKMQKTFSIEKYANYVSSTSGTIKETLITNLEAALGKVNTDSLSDKNKSLLARVWGKIKSGEKSTPTASKNQSNLITKNSKNVASLSSKQFDANTRQ